MLGCNDRIQDAVIKAHNSCVLINAWTQDSGIILALTDSVDLMDPMGVDKRKRLLKAELKGVCVSVVQVSRITAEPRPSAFVALPFSPASAQPQARTENPSRLLKSQQAVEPKGTHRGRKGLFETLRKTSETATECDGFNLSLLFLTYFHKLCFPKRKVRFRKPLTLTQPINGRARMQTQASGLHAASSFKNIRWRNSEHISENTATKQ